MKATTPPKLMPPFHRTAASGIFPTEQTNEMIATNGPMRRKKRRDYQLENVRRDPNHTTVPHKPSSRAQKPRPSLPGCHARTLHS